MTKPRPRNIANDILDCVETATAKWTQAEEIRGAASRQYPVSRLAHDERAAHHPEGGRLAK